MNPAVDDKPVDADAGSQPSANNEQADQSAPRRTIIFAAKLAISLTLLVVIFQDLSWETLAEPLSRLPMSVLLIATLLMAIQVVAACWRWRQVMIAVGDQPPRPSDLLRSYLIGLFVSQGMPSTMGGDALRIIHGHGWGQSWQSSSVSVLLERVIAVLVLGALLVAASAVEFLDLSTGAAVLVGAVSLAAATGLFYVLSFAGHALKGWKGARWVEIVDESLHLCRRAARDGRLLAIGTISSVVSHGTVFTAAFVMFQGLGVDLTMWQVTLGLAVVMLATMLPITIGGWGLRENMMAGTFGLFGAPLSESVIVSLSLGVMIVIISLPGVVIWFRDSAREN